MQFVSERFAAKVIFGDPWDCWEWQGATSGAKCGKPYGHLIHNGKMQKAHRVAFAWFHGREIAPGMEIMHLCDNPPCVNPAHLKEGTHRENMLDSHAKGRSTTVIQTLETMAKQRANTPRGDRSPVKRPEYRLKHSGEANGNSKLTREQVTEIRRLRSEEGMTLTALGQRFGVNHTLIGFIVRGEIWPEEGQLRPVTVRPKRNTPVEQPLVQPQKARSGEVNGNRRLGWEQVREIRCLAENGKLSHEAIALRFGVHQTTVSHIVTGRTWRE